MSVARIADLVPATKKLEGALVAAAYFSLAAGLAHLWATPQHQAVWWGYGAFFVTAGLAQTAFGFLLFRRLHPVIHAGAIWANVAVIIVYVLTRTSGIPIGPHATVIEDPALLDTTTAIMELGLVLALVSMLSNRHRTWTVNGLLVVGAVVWGLRVIGYIP